MLVALACLLLAGCLDLEHEVVVGADGNADAIVRVSADREIGEVTSAVEMLARLSGDPALAAVGRDGLCSGAGLERVPPAAVADIEAQRSLTADRSVCEVRKRGLPLAREKLDPLGLGLLTVTPSGPRQIDLALDLEKLPDVTPLLMFTLLDELQKRPQIQGATRHDLYELTERLKRAATAVTAMTLRDRTLQLIVRAPRIVAVEGAAARDATSARFRLTFAELVDLLLRPEARRGRRMAVTVAY